MLHQQIESNKRKTVYILFMFVLFVLALGAAISLIWFDDIISGMIISIVFCIIYIPIVMASSQSIIMRMNHAHKITDRQQNVFLWSTVENLAMVARIPMPSIYVIHDSSPNAFAMGMKPEKASVAITTGLMEVLTKEEIEAVMAHEIAL